MREHGILVFFSFTRIFLQVGVIVENLKKEEVKILRRITSDRQDGEVQGTFAFFSDVTIMISFIYEKMKAEMACLTRWLCINLSTYRCPHSFTALLTRETRLQNLPCVKQKGLGFHPREKSQILWHIRSKRQQRIGTGRSNLPLTFWRQIGL